MDILGFEFKKKSSAQPAAAKDTELPTQEHPAGLSPGGSLLKAEPHTGTRFNRKIIMAVVGGCLLIGFFAMISALQQPVKATPQEEAEIKAAKDSSKPITSAVAADIIQEAPDSYSKLSQYEADKLARQRKNPKLGEPVPPVVGSLKNPAQSIGSVNDVSKSAISSYNSDGHSGGRSQLSPEEKELIDSRKSPIKFAGFQSAQSSAGGSNNGSGNPKSARSMIEGLLKGGGGEDGEGSGGGMGGIMGAMSSIAGAASGGGGKDDQNMQTEKRKFIEGEKKNKDKNYYVQGSLNQPVSAYEVKSGSIIPGVMITGINSDLPGNIVAQVRENVFDTVTGHYLLIPQGTRIIGTYDSKVAYAQERVLIVWTRLIYPNGDSIDLEGMGGVDLSGYAGLSDQVNNHYLKLLGGVVLSTMLTTSAKIAAGNNAAGQADIPQLAVSGASEQVSKVGEKFTEKNLSVQPTLEITPGFKFNVFVSKDLILKPYRQS